MKKRLPFLTGGLLIIYVFAFLGLQILAKDKEFSDLENRNLSSRPEFSTETLLDGSYGTDFETYIADQFPLRNQFISVKAYMELMLQKKDNNDVYIGKDDYFLQKFNTPDMEVVTRNANYINEFAKNFNVYVGIAPTATKVLEEKLPAYANPYDEEVYINNFHSALSDDVNKLDFLSILREHKEEYIYYKTDHHWTTLGAYYAYTELCSKMGITPLDMEEFDIETVSDEFYGTLFSKGNFTFATPDSIQIFDAKKENPVTVKYEGNGKETDTLYELHHLDTKDKYSIFLDNNHPLVKISTSVKNGKKLLIIKDSYANCFIPFLTHHFEEIQIIDLRLMNAPVTTLAKEAGITDVLMLYNVQNFSTENKLSLLLN